ncbi:hypothetical protein BD779DRAFT_1798723 [Infundibulicybe gibba]|nr:hypothetical protein BD779DRAFT_1798723 [Infundibulicybe gibba]
MFNSRIPYSPESSPPSSPNIMIDSSPPSSPIGSPLILNHDTPPPPMHPFAASIKADRIPRDHEKKPSIPYLYPPHSPVKKPRYAAHARHDSFDSVFNAPVQTPEDREAAIWDDAITQVFDGGHGAVSLTDMNLRRIPLRFISDLEKFYIPPEKVEQGNAQNGIAVSPSHGGRLFTRVTTAPAGPGNRFTKPFRQHTSISSDVPGLPREEVSLFLSGNRITHLPLELLNLRTLTVLSLRGNLLTEIPPEIRNLTNLRALNVANNKLTYLPAEMLQMSLKQLHLQPNPFLEPPNTSASTPRQNRSRQTSRSGHLFDRYVASPTSKTLPRVIPLVELCLRTLLAASPEDAHETILSTHYELPLHEYPTQPNDPPVAAGKQRLKHTLPPHLRNTLDVCSPGSVYLDGIPLDTEDQARRSKVTGTGICSSPQHLKQAVFIEHAVERFTWVTEIGGISVGGLVPLRWRGCNHECLDYLDETRQDDTTGISPEIDAHRDGDEASIVQAIDFSRGLDEFDD